MPYDAYIRTIHTMARESFVYAESLVLISELYDIDVKTIIKDIEDAKKLHEGGTK